MIQHILAQAAHEREARPAATGSISSASAKSGGQQRNASPWTALVRASASFLACSTGPGKKVSVRTPRVIHQLVFQSSECQNSACCT